MLYGKCKSLSCVLYLYYISNTAYRGTGFIVSFGSEHNTPALEPILLRTRDCDHLSEKLRAINYEGACRIAAHQAGSDSVEEGNILIHKAID